MSNIIRQSLIVGKHPTEDNQNSRKTIQKKWQHTFSLADLGKICTTNFFNCMPKFSTPRSFAKTMIVIFTNVSKLYTY